jgi:hypothetical protein
VSGLGGIVYVDASIVTRDPANPAATAMWVVGDRIAAVGDVEVVRATAGHAAHVVSLSNRTVLPGLIDAHCHLTWFGYLLTGANCSADAAPNIPAIQQLLAAAEPGAEGWVMGSGYAEYQLEEHRAPTRWELDEAVPDFPCVVYQTSMHVCVVNSAGLLELDLSDESEEPPRGRLGRDSNGRLDGRLFEAPMFELMERNMYRYLAAVGAEGRAALMEGAGESLASMGITSCADASTGAASFSAMRQAEGRGRLPIRVSTLFAFPEARWLLSAGMTTGFGSDYLRIGGIKVWADGGMSSRTAAVDEPYLDPQGETGILWHDESELAGMIAQCEEAGFQIAIHAQGERAIRAVLGAFESTTESDNPLRHRIEHGGAFPSRLRELAGRQRIHVVSQPGFISQLGDGFIEAFGPERSDYLYPFASLQAAGVIVAGSSDTPVIDPSPFLAMRDAVVRRTRNGLALGEDEAISISDALDLYTRNAAFVGWTEDQVGTLEVGKLADFVIVNQSPLSAVPASVADTKVHLTVVGGRVVFDDGSTRD